MLPGAPGVRVVYFVPIRGHAEKAAGHLEKRGRLGWGGKILSFFFHILKTFFSDSQNLFFPAGLSGVVNEEP